MRTRNFIITYNNPKHDIYQYGDIAKAAGANSFQAQLERGESGTLHIQAFVSFPNPKMLTAVKRIFPNNPHIEAAKNALKAWEYCGKSETRVEGPHTFGPVPKPQKQSKGDTKSFNDLCLTLGPEKMVETGQLSLRDYAKIKHATNLYKLTTATLTSNPELKNEWLYGPTGTGKSRSVRERFPDAFIKNPSKWWDGYEGQKEVIIDDYQKEHSWLGYFLKIWGDHYPFTAEVKGSSLQARPERILVTSNYHPRDIWEDRAILDPILRRFKVIEFKQFES